MGKRKLTKPSRAKEKPGAKSEWKFWAVAAAVLVILGGGVTYWALTPGAGASIGQTAPDFSLQLFNGQSLALASLKGKPVLVNFWAST